MRRLIGSVAIVLGLLVLRYRGRDVSPGMRWVMFFFLWIIALFCFFANIPWVLDLCLVLICSLTLGLLVGSMIQGGVGSGGVTIDRRRSPIIFWLSGACMAAYLLSYIVEGARGLLHDFH